MQKLKADIKNRQFKNCYLFYGEEDYLKRLYRDSLKAAVLNGGDDMNCTRFQGKETDVVQIKDLADTLPFFSDYRLIIVENSGLFKSAMILQIICQICRTLQSYFLWRLGQQELARTIFPLGDITKEEIKQYVEKKGFHEKVEKKESMEVCFIPGDYRDFLREQLPDLDREVTGGYFIDAAGRKLGQHKGFPFYTIGQRKGLEIALGKPMFVTRINPIKNTIRLGERSELLTRNMVISDVIETIPGILNTSEPVDVQIRYRSAAIPATLRKGETPNEWIVCFQSDASAVTPGQSAVIYQNDCIIGGGIIADQRLLKKYAL